jgi:hypothetical protein
VAQYLETNVRVFGMFSLPSNRLIVCLKVFIANLALHEPTLNDVQRAAIHRYTFVLTTYYRCDLGCVYVVGDAIAQVVSYGCLWSIVYKCAG